MNNLNLGVIQMGGGSFLYSVFPCISGYCYLRAVVEAQNILTAFNRVNNLSRYKSEQELVIQKLNSRKI
jgi:hypothetical protein